MAYNQIAIDLQWKCIEDDGKSYAWGTKQSSRNLTFNLLDYIVNGIKMHFQKIACNRNLKQKSGNHKKIGDIRARKK